MPSPLAILIRRILVCALVLTSPVMTLAKSQGPNSERTLRDGDILFQDSHSDQSDAIKALTHSPFSHCAIYMHGKVIESGCRGRRLSLSAWILRDGSHYKAERLKGYPQGLPAAEIVNLENAADGYAKKPYNGCFYWDPDSEQKPDSIYCSQLVWLAYRDTLDVKLVDADKFQRFSDFQIEGQTKDKLLARYKDANLKYDPKVKVLTPQKLFESDKLFIVVNQK